MAVTFVDLEHRKSASRGKPGSQAYPLGYSDGEIRRLEAQGEFLRDLTEDLLRRTGVGAGMRVLDIGCGAGDVSLLAGSLVGPSGAVVGVDRSEAGLGTARRRAAAAGQSWLRFECSALDDLALAPEFDAVIGRLILMYLPDPAATLRRLSRSLRPGGIVALQEMAMPLARVSPQTPLFRQCIDWIIATFERAGIEIDMGGKLLGTFLSAGLPVPKMIGACRVEGGPDSPVYDYYADVLRSLLPMMERHSVATAAVVSVETLASRLRQEAVEHRASVMPPPLIGAWAGVPG
jgi:SAM-dependent methyltransferase